MQTRTDLIKLLIENGANPTFNVCGRAPWEVLFGNYPVDKQRKQELKKCARRAAKENKEKKWQNFKGCLVQLLKGGLKVNAYDPTSKTKLGFASTMLKGFIGERTRL